MEEPSDELRRDKWWLATLRRLAAYLTPYTARLVVQVSASVAITVAGLLPPTITGWIIDRVVAPQGAAAHDIGHRLRLLGFYVVALLGIRLVSWGLEWTHSWTVAWIGARVTADIRSQHYRH